MVLVAVASVGAACGSDVAEPPATSSTATRGSEPPSTAAPSSTTTTTVVAPTGDEAEVRAVIDRYWDAWFIAAGNPPDPANAELNAVLTGDARMRIIGGIERRLGEGTYVRLPEGSVFERSVTSVTFDERGIATVEECVVDDSELIDLASDSVLDAGVATVRLSTTANAVDGEWRITTITTVDKEDGVATCDE